MAQDDLVVALQQATVAIQKLKKNLADYHAPIAIIGMSCRFPGPKGAPADTPAKFWQQLRNGVNAIQTVPTERWDVDAYYDPDINVPGKTYTRHGGFLAQIDHFDPAFFGLSPREVTAMDPQHRLLLETSWEALEYANLLPDSLFNTPVGVFIGFGDSEYGKLQPTTDYTDLYAATGTTGSTAAGRISYLLGLTGPCITVDTACSSSLTAIHLACQSLRNGECDAALAGGVNLMLGPEITILFAKGRMLAADGQCKTFDAAADGYVRSEGCSMIVLKRLSDALANHDNVLAVIRGTAINQDGPSGGLTVPNGPSQEKVITRALHDAKLKADQISYVEAHGTGTQLGDPIEIGALQAVFGQRTEPLYVGSVKTNLGHLEFSAGIAGLLKVVLSLQAGEIPPHLHFQIPNPHIDWRATPIQIPTGLMPWPQHQPGRERIAGLSSFGYSGTNAHIIVAEASPVKDAINVVERQAHLLTLSAKSEQALCAYAQRYHDFLNAYPETKLGDLCYTTHVGRSHFAYRLSVTATSVVALQAQLAAYTAGVTYPGVSQGLASQNQAAPKVAFLFTGQGAQYVGMGRELYATQPTFRTTLDRCDELLRPLLGESILQVLYPELGAKENSLQSPPSNLIHQTAYTQPALFALEYALATLWQSWGIQPAVVMGHSVGEVVAACIAGVFSLEDALKLIAARGRLMDALPRDGAMVAVLMTEARVREAIATYSDAERSTEPSMSSDFGEPHSRRNLAEVSIAAVNGLESVVISGKQEAIQALTAQLTTVGVKTQPLTVSHAFHSALMEPMVDAFYQVLKTLSYAKPKLRLVSNVTGQLADDEIASAAYWVRHVRAAVRFADGVQTLQDQGIDICLEIGPKPVLLGLAQPMLDRQASPCLFLPSLRPPQSDWQTMLESLGHLYTRGLAVDWAGFDRDYDRRKVVLPTYPFQRQRYWVETGTRQQTASVPQNTFANWLGTHNLAELVQRLIDKGEFRADQSDLVTQVLVTLEAESQEQQRIDHIERMLYEVAWEEQPLSSHGATKAAPSVAAGRWLILTDEQGVGALLAQQLAAAGQTVTTLAASADFAQLTAQLATQPENTPPLHGVIHLWGLQAASNPTRLDVTQLTQIHQESCGSVLHLVQQLATHAQPPHLWVVTQGAQPVTAGQPPMAVAQSPLWGLGRVIALEQPALWGGLIDLDMATDLAQSAQNLRAELLNRPAGAEDQIAYRHDIRYVARLVRAKVPKAAQQSIVIRTDASYLITGGVGALGLLIAQWLVAQGAKQLILTSRHGITQPEQQKTVDALAAQGVNVQLTQVDVADAAAMQQLFAQIAASPAPLKGVFHTAGVLDDGILLNQTWERFAKVMGAKVTGSWLLHQLSATMALDVMVFFSSAAALLGNPGQSNYAAANAFMDGLACYRQQQGLPGLSINWGAWGGLDAQSGMAARTKQLPLGKTQMLTPEAGLMALEILWSHTGQIGVLPIDWAQGVTRTGRATPFIARWLDLPPVEPPASPIQVTLGQELAALAPDRRLESLRLHLQQTIGRVLGMRELPARAIGFADLGMDSLMALELKRHLERAIGVTLPMTLAFEYPTVDTLAVHLLTEVLHLADTAATVATNAGNGSQRRADNTTEPIAVISIGCRFPGAQTPEAFWALLQDGVDTVGPIPLARWNVDDYYDPHRPTPGKMYMREAALIDQVDQFDPRFFGISPREATGIDPQHRLLLEVCWEALERAGLSQSRLVESQTGVFVGIGSSDYALLDGAQPLEALDIHSGTNNGHSMAAGRLAYNLGLQGPAIAVDTACSSSLVALHLACQSLRTSECDLALAGGVSLILSPTGHVALSQMQALAPDGRCKTFDATADGYGRGEGCSMVLLKRLADALADGDVVLAVIKGSAVNHDGPSSGLTVPNKRAQAKLLRQALRNAQVEPSEVGYIEAHGTGTPLGDPIELRALGSVFGKDRKQPLWVGSVKTNIGHLEAAAGIAGVVKVVLALHHNQIPPHLHFTTPNPYIEWDEYAIDVPTSIQAWPTDSRVAGVSAFGLSGTNAHVILAQAALVSDKLHNDTPVPARVGTALEERPWHLLNLSAKSGDALRDLVARYVKVLATQPAIKLGDLCYTAMIGRNHFDQRVSLVVDSTTALQTLITAYQQGETHSSIRQNRVDVEQGAPRIAFLFTGQGAQYVDMGRELYATQPIFRAALDRCDQVLREYLGESILPVLYPEIGDWRLEIGDEDSHLQSPISNLIDQTFYTQPALFALEYALAQLWRAWGIVPDVVMGHSVGEVVAACVAGVFSLEDGLKLVAARGRLMQALPTDGTMVAVVAAEARVQHLLAPYADTVAIAAVNGPESVVISGQRASIQALVAALAAEGVKTRPLTVSHAFHSPLMAPMLDAFRRVAETVTYATPKLRLVSNVTGKLASNEITTPAYWVRHVRAAVRFADGVATLHEQDAGILIEIGPKPTLLGMAQAIYDLRAQSSPTIDETSSVDESLLVTQKSKIVNPVFLSSLRENRNDWQQMLESLGALYVQGVNIDWANFEQGYIRHKVLLPTYPFQRQRYWLETAVRQKNGASQAHEGLGAWLATTKPEQLAQQIIAHAALSAEDNLLVTKVLQTVNIAYQAQCAAKQIEEKLYEVAWQAQTQQPLTHESVFPGHWLILADQNGLGAALAGRLKAAGQQVTLLYHTTPTRLTGVGVGEGLVVSADDPLAFRQLMQDAIQNQADTLPLRGIIHLWALDLPASATLTAVDFARTQSLGCGSLLHLVQAVLQAKKGSDTPSLWVITRGAQPVGLSAPHNTVEFAQTALWGMGRVISMEHPNLWGGLIDLDVQTGMNIPAMEPALDLITAEATALWHEVFVPQMEEQVAYRQGQRYVARLVPAHPQTQPQAMPIRGDGSYLITGGVGELGLRAARWLAEQGAKQLVLTSRHGVTTPRQQAAVAALASLGATIKIVQVDVADAQGMARLFAEFSPETPLRGVIHAAGTSGFQPLATLRWEDFYALLRPKVAGAWILHNLTQALDLDFFVCYASGAGIWGGKQQAHYGAANHFLDGLVAHRRTQGLPGLSIAWGPWSGGGMATPEAQATLMTMGIRSLSPDQGIAILAYLLGTGASQITAADIQWSQFKALYMMAKPRQFLAALTISEPDVDAAQANGAVSEQAQKIRVKLTSYTEVLAFINREIATVLHLQALDTVDSHCSFADLGMDSLLALELRNRLQRSLDRALAATIVFDYPTPEKLSVYLAGQLFPTHEEGRGNQAVMPDAASAVQLRELDELSTDEVGDLLDKELQAAANYWAEEGEN